MELFKTGLVGWSDLYRQRYTWSEHVSEEFISCNCRHEHPYFYKALSKLD